MEPIYRQTFPISAIHLDCTGRMKPSAILYFAQESAGQHCMELGTDWETMAKKGLFWAIIRNHVQIRRLPREGEVITVETWPMPTTRVAYPRSMVATDEAGEVLFQVHSLWVLMDMHTRTMVQPAKSGVEVSGILRDTEIPAPGSVPPFQTDHSTPHRVCFSDLDRNGHMNNVRYLDCLADLLPSAFHAGHIPVEMTLGYLSESREGDVLDLGWTLGEDNILHAEITCKDAEKGKTHRVFAARICYDSEIM